MMNNVHIISFAKQTPMLDSIQCLKENKAGFSILDTYGWIDQLGFPYNRVPDSRDILPQARAISQ